MPLSLSESLRFHAVFEMDSFGKFISIEDLILFKTGMQPDKHIYSK